MTTTCSTTKRRSDGSFFNNTNLMGSVIYSNPVQEFARCMNDHGIRTDEAIVDDGQLRRFHINGDRIGSKNGWYVLHGDTIPCGVFGSWKTGQTISWQNSSQPHLSANQLSELEVQQRLQRDQRDRERAREAQRAASLAQQVWDSARQASSTHPYLIKKSISANGLRSNGSDLLVPIRSIDGKLISIQTITLSGSKRFFKGGQISGGFWLCGDGKLPSKGTLYVCEGVATASTVHKITGKPSVAALTAGNLQQVTKLIQWARPDLGLIVAADNDHRTEGNPGLTKARITSNRLKIPICVPDLPCGVSCTCSDFNDLALCGGRNHG